MRKNTPPPAERVLLARDSPWWGEHRSRYHLAATQARGSISLDIACGTGFGSEILADAGAPFVVGTDIDVGHVTSNPRVGELAFVAANGIRLPFRDGQFDLITSFETIEHIQKARAFIGELRRVARSGGYIVMSTPNSLRAPKQHDGRPANPFHVREYEPLEFREILEASFSHVELLGQVMKHYYPVCPFWESDAVTPQDLRTKIKVLLWKIQNRLPYVVKDGYSRLVHRRSFYPGEFDWEFSSEHESSGHVLVALCRP